ncbi:MAG TPA: carboxypeptidase-like regulatory domain-containing protein [Candidatus Cybelea sp.]|jgi:hypothetical protein
MIRAKFIVAVPLLASLLLLGIGGGPSVSFAGQVLVASSSDQAFPAEHVELFLQDQNNRLIGPSYTDSNGYFQFFDIAGGNYTLDVLSGGSLVWKGAVRVPARLTSPIRISRPSS